MADRDGLTSSSTLCDWIDYSGMHSPSAFAHQFDSPMQHVDCPRLTTVEKGLRRRVTVEPKIRCEWYTVTISGNTLPP